MYAHIRRGRVVHISDDKDMQIDGAAVVEIPDGVVVDVFDEYKNGAFGKVMEHFSAIHKVAFMLTFTVAERIKIRELAATNPVLKDLLLLLADKEYVNLDSMPLPDIIDYILDTLDANGIPIPDKPKRKAEILSGKPARQI